MKFSYYFSLILLICIGSESCSLPNVSYAIYSSSGSNLVIKSKLFSKTELIDECHEDFIEEIFEEFCQNSTNERKTPTKAQSYGYGFLAVFIVSILSVAGLFAFPILYSVSFKYVLSLFTSLAVGTLFGDTMFHLIPFTLGLHNHNHSNEHAHSFFSVPDYIWKMLVSVLVLYSFYLLEIVLHSCTHPKHKNIVGHSNANPSQLKGDISDNEVEFDEPLHQKIPNESNNNNNESKYVSCNYSNGYIPVTVFADDSKHNNELKKINPFIEKTKNKSISSIGWMVLIGDGIHNFADGLAIGAAFSQDLILGLTTTIAIGLHELPHELGDYSILIRSGFSHCRAILWNFISATTAFIGFFIGVTLSSNDHIRQWIFAITIGMFIYIALVDLLPTLLTKEQFDFKRFVIVNIGFLCGLIIMFLLALFENNLIRSSK